MDFYLGLAQIVGVHTLLGLSAYCVLLTGQVSLAQAGFFAIGAYVAAMLTVLAGWHILPAVFGSSAIMLPNGPALLLLAAVTTNLLLTTAVAVVAVAVLAARRRWIG